MEITNEFVLRPRFKLECDVACAGLLEKIATAQKTEERFGISTVDNHVFIRLPKAEQQFWSPQLHLEIVESSDNRCSLHGFFGPNPTVWTMFIFFHVVVGTLFLADMVWLYSNAQLGYGTAIQMAIGLGLVATWILLYIAGSIGKKKGKQGMRKLYWFMLKTIE